MVDPTMNDDTIRSSTFPILSNDIRRQQVLDLLYHIFLFYHQMGSPEVRVSEKGAYLDELI
jgi:hypothetical protein